MTSRRGPVALALVAFQLVALTFIALVALAPPSGAHSARTAQSPQATTTGGLLRLDEPIPAIEPGGDLHIAVRVTSAPPGAIVRATVFERTPTRSSFQQTLEGPSRGRRLNTPVEAPLVAGQQGPVVITIGTRPDSSGDPTRLRLGEGVYPVVIQLVDRGDIVDEIVSYAIRLRSADAGPPLGVAMIVPVGTPAPSLQTDGTTQVDDAGKRSIVDTTSVLLGHAPSPVTLEVRPETADALRQTDDTPTLSSLKDAVGRGQLAPRTYVPVDGPAWLGSGLSDLLRDELSGGAQALSDTVGAPAKKTWVADRPIDSAMARWLHGEGVTQIVIPEAGLSPLDLRRFPATLTQPFLLNGIDGMRAVAADTALAAHVGSTGDPMLDANHLVADLAILDLDHPQVERLAVVALPVQDTLDPAFLDAALTGIATTRTLQAGGLDNLLASTLTVGGKGETDGSGSPLTRELVAPKPGNIGSFADALRSTRANIDSYTQAVDAANPRLRTLSAMARVSGDETLDRDEARSYLDGADAMIRTELGKIAAPPKQTITFTARDGVVSLAVRNETGYPVQAMMQLAGPRLEFPDHPDGLVPLTLTGEVTRVEVAVRARSSGDATLEVAILTPDLRLPIDRTRVTVRSTAFSGVGIVLSAGAIAFLLVWWLKHTRTVRRRRRAPVAVEE